MRATFVMALMAWMPSVAEAEDTVRLVSARLGGQVTTQATPRVPYVDGPLRYEVLVKNSGDAALRTNLIVELPTGQDASSRRLYAKIPVSIGAGASSFVGFVAPGFTTGGCYAMNLFYVRMENNAAAAKTVRIEPNCDFEAVLPAQFASAPGRIAMTALRVIQARNLSSNRFRCESGLALEAKIANDTSHDDAVAVVLSSPTRQVASSPRATLRAGTTTTLRLGWFDSSFQGLAQQVKVELSGPRTRIAQPSGFEIRRKCYPNVSLVDGDVDGRSVRQRIAIVQPERELSIASATYGRNCNLAFPQADIARDVASQCRTARGTCNYELTWAPWGGRDPSPSLCKKYVDISYQCGWAGPMKTTKVLHEKTPQTVTLSCQ